MVGKPERGGKTILAATMTGGSFFNTPLDFEQQIWNHRTSCHRQLNPVWVPLVEDKPESA